MQNEPKCFLTRAQALEIARKTGRVSIYHNTYEQVFFYTDDYCWRAGNEIYGPLADDAKANKAWVPCSLQFPMQVVEREGVEDGCVDSMEKLELVFYSKDVYVDSWEHLKEHQRQFVVNKRVAHEKKALDFFKSKRGPFIVLSAHREINASNYFGRFYARLRRTREDGKSLWRIDTGILKFFDDGSIWYDSQNRSSNIGHLDDRRKTKRILNVVRKITQKQNLRVAQF